MKTTSINFEKCVQRGIGICSEEFPAVLGTIFGLYYVTHLVKDITCTVTLTEVNIGPKTKVNLLPTLITAISPQILGPSKVLTSYFDDHGKRVI